MVWHVFGSDIVEPYWVIDMEKQMKEAGVCTPAYVNSFEHVESINPK